MAEVVERVANLEARWDAQAAQLNGIQESLVRIEDKMDRKFEAVDRKFEQFEDKWDRRILALEERWDRRFGALEQRMDAGFTESRKEFRWLMGAMAGGVVTVIVTILGALLAITRLQAWP